jgi:hypothetical protein
MARPYSGFCAAAHASRWRAFSTACVSKRAKVACQPLEFGGKIRSRFRRAVNHRHEGAHLIRAHADDSDSLADARKVLARPFVIRAGEHGRLGHERFISADKARGQGDDVVCGAPDRIRTCDLCLRRAALYPAELRVHDADGQANPNRPER